MIKLGILAALDQQIAVRYQMTGMTPEESSSYFRRHLRLVGHDRDVFCDDATTQIHNTSRGKPRTASDLSIAALIATYDARTKWRRGLTAGSRAPGAGANSVWENMDVTKLSTPVS